MYCYGKKRLFEKKSSKWPVTTIFFSVSLFSSTCSWGGVKTIEMFMFKIPHFSLASCLCKQAGLDLVSAWKDLDPRTLVSGDLCHFCTTAAVAVRWAAHCAGATTIAITIGLKPNFETWRAIFKRFFMSESLSKIKCFSIFFGKVVSL